MEFVILAFTFEKGYQDIRSHCSPLPFFSLLAFFSFLYQVESSSTVSAFFDNRESLIKQLFLTDFLA